jgi:hypothetical protein
VRGAGLELTAVLVAHGTIKNDNPQEWRGFFIAGLLDWDNNPTIRPVTALRTNFPPGIADAARPAFGTFGVQVARGLLTGLPGRTPNQPRE